MTSFKGKKEVDVKKKIAKRIDIDKVTPEGLVNLVHENANLKREIAALKENALRTHFNTEMGTREFNWCVEMLNEIKKGFATAKNLPEAEPVEKVKILTL